MQLLGIYGSPRAAGNSDILMDQALEAAQQAGAEVERLYLRKMVFDGCIECGACDTTGVCVLKDDMTEVYPKLEQASAIITASPIFFYGPPAITKAFMDRSQALWNKRALAKPKDQWKNHTKGPGYILSVGATKGANLFMPMELMAKYFYDALDRDYQGGLMLRHLEHKGHALEHPELLEQAKEFGRAVAKQEV